MTKEAFIDKIVEYYQNSRLLSINPNGHNIWRGVSHSISSQAEDLFALFVAENLNNEDLEYIVDKTFTLRKEGMESIKFRPDLAIINKGVLTHIFDLKMDMGYKRRFHETKEFPVIQENFRRLRTKDFDVLCYNNCTISINVSDKLINQIVVVSEKNEGKVQNRMDIIDAISKLDWINIYYLTGDVHPNNYEGIKPSIRKEAFDSLLTDIEKNLI